MVAAFVVVAASTVPVLSLAGSAYVSHLPAVAFVAAPLVLPALVGPLVVAPLVLASLLAPLVLAALVLPASTVPVFPLAGAAALSQHALWIPAPCLLSPNGLLSLLDPCSQSAHVPIQSAHVPILSVPSPNPSPRH